MQYMDNDYILIAEDDADDRFLLQSAFREVAKNVRLIFVENGIELLEHFERVEHGEILKLPLLLILDLNMPKKNGREAVKELKKKEYFNSFKTLILSTTSNEFEKKKCVELGVTDYYVKPSNYSSLIEMVTQFKTFAEIL
jgi:CheY-like chemotaxis protein